MATLRFQTVLLHGDDRGSVWPVREYQVELPPAKHEAYLDKLSAAYQQRLENVVGEAEEYQGFWVEDLSTYLDETEQMLRRDRFAENERKPDLVPTAVSKAAAQLVEDTLGSKAFGDTFWLDDDLAGKTLAELLVASKQRRAVPKITTERIPIGTECYYLSTNPYFGPVTYVWKGYVPSKYASHERLYVPVSEVDAEVAEVEAFPLPLALDRHNRWFARVKGQPRLEAISVKRADALRGAKAKAAHKRYWA